MNISAKLSDTLWVMKAFAMLSVFFAHMPGKGIFSDITNILGTIGVVAFFVISGYLFNTPKSFAIFWKKKCFTIVMPWLFCSLATYFLSVALGSEFSISGLFMWVLGIGSWYYFLPVLLFCFFLFSFLNSKIFCFVCIVLNAVSLTLTGMGILSVSVLCSNHINPLNWIGFFAIGYLLKRVDIKVSVYGQICSFVLFAISTVLYLILPIEKQYWSFWAFFYELVSVWFVFNLSYLLSSNKFLHNIGKLSYTIYLVHMQFAGIISSKLYIGELELILWLVRPILALVVLYFTLSIFKKLLIKIKLDKLLMLIGCR